MNGVRLPLEQRKPVSLPAHRSHLDRAESEVGVGEPPRRRGVNWLGDDEFEAHSDSTAT